MTAFVLADENIHLCSSSSTPALKHNLKPQEVKLAMHVLAGFMSPQLTTTLSCKERSLAANACLQHQP